MPALKPFLLSSLHQQIQIWKCWEPLSNTTLDLSSSKELVSCFCVNLDLKAEEGTKNCPVAHKYQDHTTVHALTAGLLSCKVKIAIVKFQTSTEWGVSSGQICRLSLSIAQLLGMKWHFSGSDVGHLTSLLCSASFRKTHPTSKSLVKNAKLYFKLMYTNSRKICYKLKQDE